MSLSILKSTSIVGSMTLLSRITGLVRDVIFANVLGDRAAADVFLVAFRIPNFFRRIFGEGAFAVAFVPVFTDFRTHRSESEIASFLQIMIGRFGLILLVVSILGVIFAPALVTMLAAGFLGQPEKFDMAVHASRITFPYLFFISFVAMAGGMLNSCGRFAAPAATPALLNICLIGAALLLVPQFDHSPLALAVGVFIAGVVQLLFQIPFLRKEKLTIRPRLVRRKGDDAAVEGAGRVFRLTLPAILGVSVAQINSIINNVLASFLVTGSISWLYYSDRLMEFPLGVFGIALSTAILPDLSRKYSENSLDQFSLTMDWAVRWVYLICVPAAVGLAILSVPLVSTIYYHGDFTTNGVTMTARSLIAFAIGLIPIVLVKVLAPGFFARQNTKTPVKVGMIAMAANAIFALTLVSPLKHVGLALSTSLAAIINASVLYVLLKRDGIFVGSPGWLLFLARITGATLVMGAVVWWMMGDTADWLDYGVWTRVLRLTAIITTGGVVYFAFLLVLGIRPRMLWTARGGAE